MTLPSTCISFQSVYFFYINNPFLFYSIVMKKTSNYYVINLTAENNITTRNVEWIV